MFTTRDPRIALIGEMFKLRRKQPQSQESRAMFMRHAEYHQNSSLENRAEESMRYILERTAGLPVAHYVVGSAVALYDISCDNRMNPCLWCESMNESLVESSGDGDSSLDVVFSTAIRSFGKKNTRSSSSEIVSVRTEDYMRMHRSLCVFEKQ